MQAALSVKNLSKSYGEHMVLDQVSLDAQPGEVIALLGPSGSGKSTLLRCLNLLTIPDCGDIYIDGDHLELTKKKGQTVPKYPRQVQKIRTTCGMVFQQFNLWSHMTALENVMEAPVHVLKEAKDVVSARAHMLLDKVGLGNKAHHYPAQLSGGQQQRVAIARALAMQPKLMLFDEPTSALDPQMVGEVLSVMRAIAKEGKTMVVATHEMAFAREVASKVVFLEHGKIVISGDPKSLFVDKSQQRFQDFIKSGLSEE